MTDEAKPLQATFDVDDYDSETVEGIGFEPGTKYTFSIEKAPRGQYMQYGAAKGGLYVLSKKTPKDLLDSYQKHPDQYEIFSTGEINGQQALVPGRDFEKFKPFLTPVIKVAWVCAENKRLVFMDLNADKPAVNETHPEWESMAVRLARKLGYDVPAPGSKEKFRFDFLHPGVTIQAEILMVKRKNTDKENPVLDLDTIVLLDSEGTVDNTQKKIVDDIDPTIRGTVLDLADGCKTVPEVLKKVKEHLKKDGAKPDPALLGQYASAITKMKDSKEILG